jgi:hypothetical protein
MVAISPDKTMFILVHNYWMKSTINYEMVELAISYMIVDHIEYKRENILDSRKHPSDIL